MEGGGRREEGKKRKREIVREGERGRSRDGECRRKRGRKRKKEGVRREH